MSTSDRLILLQNQINELQEEVISLQGALKKEKLAHFYTTNLLNETKKQYEELINTNENQCIRHQFQEIAIENTQLKTENRVLTQQIEKLQIALLQENLNLQQLTAKQTTMTNQSVQASTIDINDYDQSRQEIEDLIQWQQQAIPKFINQYIQQKQIRNKSTNEVKFYNSINQALENLVRSNSIIQQKYQQFISQYDQKDNQLEEVYIQLEDQKSNNINLHQQYQSEIDALNKQVISKNQEIVEISRQYQTLKNEHQLIKEQNQKQQHQLQLMKSDLTSLSQELNSTKIEYTTEREKVEKQLQQYKKQTEEALMNSQQSYKSLNDHIKQQEILQTQKDQLQIEINGLEQNLKKITAKIEEYQQIVFKLTIERDKATLEKDHYKNLYDNLYDQNDKLQNNSTEIIEKYAELQRLCGKLEEENNTLTTYTHKLQQDLQQRNIQLQELNSHIQSLEQQLYQSQPKFVENNYLSTKVEDLEGLIRDKDQKIDEVERLYNLTNYELRMLQEYHESLNKEIEQYKLKIQELQVELEQSYRDQNSRNGDDKLRKQVDILEGQLAQYNRQKQHQDHQNKPIVQVKILKGEIQRLSQQLIDKKQQVKDLQIFIEKLITATPENQQLARQIIIESQQRGDLRRMDEENFESSMTFGIERLDEDPQQQV